ncbi:2-amino-4-hydroxy-6-hydroxymethyldihydropteridine diphosphokinase [Filimonas effusa]|uniref:2-amino-4-hydroxy-6-hydroxymethyldihydropteridine pyrophosphokinase n=1 Tax=Filimonas effusa TaxID=2508721 RepID=A0A4Q1DCZ6_9BACT|nr:2-amino-4-hydroxy-6-hydroxymethyldihydropteridine diphosphokinase [Filimonas effusa]RXK86429.1 2-amino-4-hydroxy-6-hydroxymethyldihydropteridine diphosphokinase [Filimonas effusa]
MNRAYLLIGGNLGDRTAYLDRAKELIQERCGILAKVSAIYETAAWGLEEQPDFYNQALLLETELSAGPLMQQLLDIELVLGRKRDLKMGPRTIDIDILLFNDEIMATPLITVPHPRLPSRRFALLPLVEIAAEVVHPQLHETITRLLALCTDTLDVHKIS